MKSFATYLAVFGAVLVIVFLDDNGKNNNEFDKALAIKYQSIIDKVPAKLTSNANQSGNVHFLVDNTKMSESSMRQGVARFAKSNATHKDHMLMWYDSTRNTATATAMGIDWQHYFVNSYLVGIRPFPVENKWLPLYSIAQMKTYQLDSEQYRADDLWQNSAQAFMLPRGDCEDHALILADWLISEGVDAKVVVGTYKNSGHAWVVATMNNQEFLLEPTAKRIGKSWNHFPLASLATNYHADVMFNRDNFWLNRSKTKSYRTKDWLKTSIFTKKDSTL